ncbi:MAG: hypothetical protein ACHQET_11535 [Chitinophagales bacterium]
MDDLKQYFAPYLISNILFGLSIWAALKKPIVTRIFLAALFLWASLVNFSTAMRKPEVYLEYAQLSFMPFYRDFIKGFFSQHVRAFVLMVAAGQFLIFSGLCLKSQWTTLACLGGIIFGLAIVPLGVGSAFPATLLMAISFFILFQRPEHDFIWKLNQYGPAAFRILQSDTASD